MECFVLLQHLQFPPDLTETEYDPYTAAEEAKVRDTVYLRKKWWEKENIGQNSGRDENELEN